MPALNEYKIENWTYVGGSLFARKTYQRSAPAPGGGTDIETTSFDLKHTPG